MSVSTSVELYGVREALSELGKIDKKLRAEAVRKVKQAGSELTAAGAAEYPDQAPASGWSEKGRLGYKPSKVRQGVQIQVGGRQPRGAKAFAVVTVIQKNAGGALWDIAGLRGGNRGSSGRKGRPNFVPLMDDRHGPAQRGLWKVRLPIQRVATKKIVEAVQEIAAQANRNLVA